MAKKCGWLRNTIAEKVQYGDNVQLKADLEKPFYISTDTIQDDETDDDEEDQLTIRRTKAVTIFYYDKEVKNRPYS